MSSAPIKGAAAAGPVFLLAGGGRTGSTLIQRLIISTRQVMVWGEHGGLIVPQLRRLFLQTHAWIDQAYGYGMLEEFRTDGANAWVANINPEAAYLQAGCRAFFEQYLGAAARSMGYPRWGFKEIRYGADEVRTLQALFPRASFVFLVRNPASCLRSIKAADWYGKEYQADPAQFLAEWSSVSGGLASIYPDCRNACLLRYEDAVANPAATVSILAKTIRVPVSAFDLSVFGKKQRGNTVPPAELDEADLRALHAPDVLGVAEMLGYPPLAQPA